MEELIQLLKEQSQKLNINLTDEQIQKFIKYKELLQEWNKKVNLTAILEDRDIIIKHFVDSLTIERYIKNKESLIDVGTGGGFPGIPIKIIREDINISLLDSLSKRLIFLEEVINELNFTNIKTIHGRAEDIAQNIEYRENYDIAVARAVANTSTLSELCLGLIKIGGLFICMKGNNIENELKEAKSAIKIMGGEIEKVEKVNLLEDDMERNIIIIRKTKETPKKYPRRAGIPSKEPIKMQ